MSTEKQLHPELFVDVIKFEPSDYYDEKLWPELEKYKSKYESLEYD